MISKLLLNRYDDIKGKIFSFINAREPRTALAKKNIMLMFLYKGGSILLGVNDHYSVR